MIPENLSTWLALAWLLFLVLGRLRASGWLSDDDQLPFLSTRTTQASNCIEQIESGRAALLVPIARIRGTLETTRGEIAVLKDVWDAQPQSVRAMLTGHAVLFSEYLPRIEAGVRQAEAIRRELVQLQPSVDRVSFDRLSAECHAVLSEVRMCNDNAGYVIRALNERLLQAMARAGGP